MWKSATGLVSLMALARTNPCNLTHNSQYFAMKGRPNKIHSVSLVTITVQTRRSVKQLPTSLLAND